MLEQSLIADMKARVDKKAQASLIEIRRSRLVSCMEEG